MWDVNDYAKTIISTKKITKTPVIINILGINDKKAEGYIALKLSQDD